MLDSDCDMMLCFFFFFKQKTAYEMRISDWSSDVCSSDLFDPCTNIAAAGAVLSGNYHSVRAGLHPQRALRIALSMYNTGSQSRGFSNGYVGRVVGNAGVSDGIQPAAVRIGEPMPATDTSAGSSAAAQPAALVEENTSDRKSGG